MNEAYDTPFMRALLAADQHCMDDDGRQERYLDRSRNLYPAPETTLPPAPDKDGLRCTGEQWETFS